jgi:phosphoribosylaminoimidazole-succinocarboxamide synthase
MSLSQSVLTSNHVLPIRTQEPVHAGKVRAVYWLTPQDSHRLGETRGYQTKSDAQLGVMIISDRLSAFEQIWHAEGGLTGVPYKGAALNAIASHWFQQFSQHSIAKHHLVESPHPLMWIVQRAKPVKIEAIIRRYLAGFLARPYAQGVREICGVSLPNGLKPNAKLECPILTPTTKGIMRGIPKVAEADDINISRQDIINNLAAFGFRKLADVARYEEILQRSFEFMTEKLAPLGQLLADTKFEFGYINEELVLIDEVGTPDSSRFWDAQAYANNRVVENSKEAFRQFLLNQVPDRDVLLNKNRMPERAQLARDTILPAESMLEVSRIYCAMAEKITGRGLPQISQPRVEMLDVLQQLDLLR